MANTDNTGFRPARNLSGNRVVVMRYPIDSTNATAVYVGDVVSAQSAGSISPATAGDGSIVVGVVTALYDSNGIPIGHPNSSTSTKYLADSTAGYADVALALPHTVFIAQGQTGQTPAAADIFATTDHVAGSGNTTTAKSGHELNFSDLNSGAQCLIVGKVDGPDNDWGEANTDVYVIFHESIFGIVDNSTGV